MIMMDPHKSVVAIMKKRKAGMNDTQSAEGHLTEKDGYIFWWRENTYQSSAYTTLELRLLLT